MASGAIGGRFLLEREIGRGAMGTVWAAVDQHLERRVALKRMNVERSPSPAARERFKREALTIASLRNPHVVQVHDYGIDGDSPYIVMELLEGEDLDARLTRLGKLPLPVVARWAKQIGAALEAAHASDVIHRDLKPANLFLVREANGEETVKVLDFGVAALGAGGAEELSPRGHPLLIGTPEYMSPEQARSSSRIDQRADLWSFGVVLYRAITGSLPFTGNTLSELLVSICIDPPRPPSELAPDLGPAVDEVLARALAKKADDRFHTGPELAAAFAAATTASTRALRILVVDDEPDVAELLGQHFRRRARARQRSPEPAAQSFPPCELRSAGRGEDALDVLRAHPDIDITLSDIRMPGMDGLTFVKHARTMRPDMPIVVVSAFGDMTNIRTAMNQGAFDFLVKPMSLSDLDATIEKALHHAREARAGNDRQRQNALLRMFVGGSVAAHIDGPAPSIEGLRDDDGEGTVVAIRVAGLPDAAFESDLHRTARALSAVHEIAIPELCARGGSIERLSGLTVVAVFPSAGGAALALSACASIRSELATLARRSAAGPDAAGSAAMEYSMCAGIASGRILRACVGSRSFGRLDYALFGEAPSAAAALLEGASPGDILYSGPATADITGSFELVPLQATRATHGKARTYLVTRRMDPRGDPLPRTLADAETSPPQSVSPSPATNANATTAPNDSGQAAAADHTAATHPPSDADGNGDDAAAPPNDPRQR
ncbi:MAG: protein kinase [Polyangiaceae bacterium]